MQVNKEPVPGSAWESWGNAYGYNPDAHGFLKSLGFTDSSYGNDAAPSFHHHELGLRLWIDAVNPKDRECQGPLLSLVQMNQDMEYVGDVFEAESWMEMASKLREL